METLQRIIFIEDDIPTVPTKTSQLINDSNFVTDSVVDEKISNAQLSGGEVDLSGYVTKERGNANQITFADGQTFQAKLDNGTLKGEKGDKGAKGDPGSTEASGVSIQDTANNFTTTNVEGALAELFQFVSTVAEELRQITSGGSTTTSYSITNNLTNATNSNSAASINEGSEYTATLTANDGYTFSTVTITMAGQDITSTVYSNNTITIPNVTGNIVITCIATQSQSGGGNEPGTGGGTDNYINAPIDRFHAVGNCDGISIDSSGNLTASTLGQWGMVYLGLPLRKLRFTVRTSQADYGALCWYIYKNNGDGTYNMLALDNVAGGENGKLFKITIPGTGVTQIDKLDISTINPGETLTIEMSGKTQTIKREDGSTLVTLTGNMYGWCGQSTNSSPFCSNVKYTTDSSGSESGGSGGNTGGSTGGETTETYTTASINDFTTLGDCDGISIDSSNNLVASTLAKWGAVKLNKDVSKLQFNVRDTQADHGALCLYIYNTYKDGAMDMYNMIALSNVAGGENGKLFKMDISTTYAQEIEQLDIPAINPGEQLTIEITNSAPTTKKYKDDRLNNTIITNEVITTHTIKRADGTILTTLTGNMSAWCGQSTNSSPFCSNIQYVPEVVYDNPSYSVKDYKITLSQDGYSEVFDANNFIYYSYCENSKDFVWEDGETYALALYAENTGSKFRINGMCPSACGYRMLNKKNSEDPYVLLDNTYVSTVNNFNFSVGVRNGDLENQYQINASLLEESLYTLNCALPAFNYSVDSNSNNIIVVNKFNATWYAATMTFDGHFQIEINEPRINEDYGTPQSSTENYKTWKSIVTHELGHTLGFDDYPDYAPSLFSYARNRAKVSYLQAPDIFTLKSLYKEQYNIDISKSQEDINAQVAALGLGRVSATSMPSGKILSINFDYPVFTNSELYDKADLIVEGKLEFDRCENINIGSENSPLILEYNIYKIIPNSVIKGEITNYELKIHVSENIDIGANNIYKLYLKQFENTPCSLMNTQQGIQMKE